MQDGDVDVVAVPARLDGRGPRIARGRADDGDFLPALGQGVVEQPAEHLHRQVFEGERGAVEQLLRPQPRVELHQRHHRRVAEACVGIPAHGVQGLERQGLRRHLPSRFSVRAESRDGNTLTRRLDCETESVSRVYRVTGVLLYLTSRRGKLKEKGRRVTPRVGQL